MFKLFRILFTHGVALAAGFALGIYLLPILIAPEGPSLRRRETSALCTPSRKRPAQPWYFTANRYMMQLQLPAGEC